MLDCRTVMLKNNIFLKSISTNALEYLIASLLGFTGKGTHIFFSVNKKSDFHSLLSNSEKYNYIACFPALKELRGNCEYILVISEEFSAVLLWRANENNYEYFYNVNTDFVSEFAKELKIDTSLINIGVLNGKTESEILSENNSSEMFDIKKMKYTAHEIKNQLSICDLYSEIIKKYCIKNNISDESLLKSAECIKNASITAGNSLLELRSSELNFAIYRVSDMVSEAISLAKVYGINKNISFDFNKTCEVEIFADKYRFISVIINLIKNACEAFDDDNVKGKNISALIRKNNNTVRILISNNAKPIKDTNLIFKEGFTEKTSGSGLGLYICKKNVEDMSGKLKLIKSDKNSTVFEITFPIRF